MANSGFREDFKSTKHRRAVARGSRSLCLSDASALPLWRFSPLRGFCEGKVVADSCFSSPSHHMFWFVFCLLFFFSPPLSLAAPSWSAKTGWHNHKWEDGRGGKLDGAEEGREGCNKVPLSAVKPVWALYSECVRTCARWWAFAQSALTPFKVTLSWASPPMTMGVQQTQPSSASFSSSFTVLWNPPR